jgi:hypothetical protein
VKQLPSLLFLLMLSVPALAQVDDVSVSLLDGRSSENWHGQAHVQALNIELTHARTPRTSISVVLSPTLFDQPRSWFGDQYGDGEETVRAISASLLLRRTWGDSAGARLYAEAGAGPLFSEKPVPASTSRFNVVSQLGVGVVLMPHSRYPVTAGYRFMHLSNGGYSPRNPGLNFSAIVVGVRTATPRRR